VDTGNPGGNRTSVGVLLNAADHIAEPSQLPRKQRRIEPSPNLGSSLDQQSHGISHDQGKTGGNLSASGGNIVQQI